MKTLFLVLLSLSSFAVCKGQITSDYPFKTFLDKDNNLYVTGYEPSGNTNDIYIAKYPPTNSTTYLWKYLLLNTNGDDMGLDLVADSTGNCFITGSFHNIISNSKDIIVIALNPNGTIHWSKIYNNPGEDKGMSISIKQTENGSISEVIISGYVQNGATGKDFIIKSYNGDDGDTTNQIHHITPLPGDDVATDILLDDFHAYVVGYTTESNGINTDIKIQTYDIMGNALIEDLTYNRPGSNEKPAEFVITEYSDNAISKSRSSVVSVTDEILIGFARQRYLTVYFDEDHNHQLQVRWAKTIWGPVRMASSIPTAITTDGYGNVFVTGYMQTPKDPVTGYNSGLDFATVKYNPSGQYGWNNPGNIIFSNYNDTSTTGMDDRASSIKINEGGVIYVAGMSQGSPNGFSIAEIKDEGRVPRLVRQNSFVPNFMDSDNPTAQKFNLWAKLELTSDGTPLMITMGWNETEAHWAAVKYGQSGNIEYTINNDPVEDKNTESDTKNKNIPIKNNNYPKSFKPARDLE